MGWNKWNSWGKGKAIFIAVCALIASLNPNIEMPGRYGLQEFIGGILMVPIISKFNQFIFSGTLVKPNWNDNPFNLRRPMVFFHTFSFFFLFVGAGIIIGTLIRWGDINTFGVITISFGLGIFAGVQLTLKLI